MPPKKDRKTAEVQSLVEVNVTVDDPQSAFQQSTDKPGSDGVDRPQIQVDMFTGAAVCQLCNGLEAADEAVHAASAEHRIIQLLLELGVWPGEEKWSGVVQRRPRMYGFTGAAGGGSVRVECLLCDAVAPNPFALARHHCSAAHVEYADAMYPGDANKTLRLSRICYICVKLFGSFADYNTHVGGSAHMVESAAWRVKLAREELPDPAFEALVLNNPPPAVASADDQGGGSDPSPTTEPVELTEEQVRRCLQLLPEAEVKSAPWSTGDIEEASKECRQLMAKVKASKSAEAPRETLRAARLKLKQLLHAAKSDYVRQKSLHRKLPEFKNLPRQKQPGASVASGTGKLQSKAASTLAEPALEFLPPVRLPTTEEITALAIECEEMTEEQVRRCLQHVKVADGRDPPWSTPQITSESNKCRSVTKHLRHLESTGKWEDFASVKVDLTASRRRLKRFLYEAKVAYIKENGLYKKEAQGAQSSSRDQVEIATDAGQKSHKRYAMSPLPDEYSEDDADDLLTSVMADLDSADSDVLQKLIDDGALVKLSSEKRVQVIERLLMAKQEKASRKHEAPDPTAPVEEPAVATSPSSAEDSDGSKEEDSDEEEVEGEYFRKLPQLVSRKIHQSEVDYRVAAWEQPRMFWVWAGPDQRDCIWDLRDYYEKLENMQLEQDDERRQTDKQRQEEYEKKKWQDKLADEFKRAETLLHDLKRERKLARYVTPQGVRGEPSGDSLVDALDSAESLKRLVQDEINRQQQVQHPSHTADSAPSYSMERTRQLQQPISSQQSHSSPSASASQGRSMQDLLSSNPSVTDRLYASACRMFGSSEAAGQLIDSLDGVSLESLISDDANASAALSQLLTGFNTPGGSNQRAEAASMAAEASGMSESRDRHRRSRSRSRSDRHRSYR